MKQIVKIAAAAAIVAVCGVVIWGSSRSSEDAPPSVQSEQQWDGVTFQSEKLNGVTIVAPEEGWEVRTDDVNGFSISKDQESLSYGLGNIGSDFVLPDTKEKLAAKITDLVEISDFSYQKSEDGKTESVEYVTQFKEKNESDTLSIIKTIVSDGEAVNIIAETSNEDESRVAQLKDIVDKMEK